MKLPTFVVFAIAMVLAVVGCFSKQDPVREKLRAYLIYNSSDKTSSNAMSDSDYRLMLDRLDASDERYVYLFHEIVGNHFVIYWFGADENANHIRISFSDGNSLAIDPSEYRIANRSYMLTGEPQYYSFPIDDDYAQLQVEEVQVFSLKPQEIKGREDRG